MCPNKQIPSVEIHSNTFLLATMRRPLSIPQVRGVRARSATISLNSLFHFQLRHPNCSNTGTFQSVPPN